MLAALIALAGPSVSSARVGAVSGGKTLYLDPAGSDANPCTQAQPCLSFGRGYAMSLPGDNVHVDPGTYGVQNIVRGSHSQAATDAPVTFEATPGTVTTGTMKLGINHGSPKGDTPNHLHFDGLGVNGCVKTNFSGGISSGASSDSIDFSFVNGHVWDMTNATCHLLNLSGLDGIVVMHTVLGPMCCGADAVEFGIPRFGAPSDANATFLDVQVHDLYDTCNNVPASIKATDGCSGTGYGDNGCCDHVDGFQGYGLLGVNRFERVRMWSINPRSSSTSGAAQGFFMKSANGGTFSNFTIENSTFGCGCGTNVVSIVAPPRASVYSGYLRVRYNTIQHGFPIYAHALAAGTTVELTGNLIGGFIHENTSTACTFVAGDGSTITPTYSHNMYGTGPAAGCGPGDLRGPALFTDTNYYNPNFTPQAGSRAIRAGDPANHPIDDVNGNPRPRNLAPDIGAIQTSHVDVTPPSLANVPADRALEASDASGTIATYASPTATDNADPSPTASCSPTSGATFPLGTTTVTCTATDASGNSSVATFHITVRDTIAPTAPGSPSPSNATRTSDDLSWAASTDAVGVTGYDLWLDGVPAGSTAGSRFTFRGLACGTAHTLTVAAHDAAGNESPQSSANVSTLPCPPTGGCLGDPQPRGGTARPSCRERREDRNADDKRGDVFPPSGSGHVMIADRLLRAVGGFKSHPNPSGGLVPVSAKRLHNSRDEPQRHLARPRLRATSNHRLRVDRGKDA